MEQTKNENTALQQNSYAQYVETRLNNRLMLLSNPDLMRALELDKHSVLSEARRLVNISERVDLTTKEDNNQQSSADFRREHSELWSDFTFSNLLHGEAMSPQEIDSSFRQYITNEIRRMGYPLLDGETEIDADKRRMAFRKANQGLWEEYRDGILNEEVTLPLDVDTSFIRYVARKEEEAKRAREAEEIARRQREAARDAYAKSCGYDNDEDMWYQRHAPTR